MASKKKGQLTRVCRIYQWIEEQDDRLAGAIHDLCMEGALTPGHGSLGVTFLYPKDKAYRDEIVETTYSDGADDAVKMINALIIPDALHNASDFQRRPVGSNSGVLYDVEEASGDSVKLKGGVALKKADNFKLLSQKEEKKDLAVWVITAGKMPLTGGEYKRPRRGAGAATGGNAKAKGGSGGALSGRANLAMQTEKEFDDLMRKDGCVARDPYLAKVVSLLDFLRAQHPDVLEAVLPLIDYNPIVSFYLLLEPYKTSGEPMIPDAMLFGPGGWNGAETFTEAWPEYKAFFDVLGTRDGPAHVCKDHAGVVAAVDRIRQRLMPINDKMSLSRDVKAVYDQLASSNSIGGLTPIYPSSTAALLRGGKKFWQDEFRFIVHAVSHHLYDSARSPSGNMYSTDDFAAVVEMVRTTCPGNNYEAEVHMIETVAWKSNVKPTSDFYLLQRFVNSTDLLFTPPPSAMVGTFMGAGDDPTDPDLYNRNYEAMRSVGRSHTRRAAGVSPQALTELKMYSLRHGGDLSGLGIEK